MTESLIVLAVVIVAAVLVGRRLFRQISGSNRCECDSCGDPTACSEANQQAKPQSEGSCCCGDSETPKQD